MDNLFEISEEHLKEDMRKTFGLLFTQDPREKDFNRYILVSALTKDGKLTNVVPNPEILRLYAIDEENKIREWADVCHIETFDMLLGIITSYNKKWKKMKVIFTADDFETIEDFTVEKCLPTHNK